MFLLPAKLHESSEHKGCAFLFCKELQKRGQAQEGISSFYSGSLLPRPCATELQFQEQTFQAL